MSDSKMTKLFELELFSIYENLTFRKINNEGLNCLKLYDFLSRTHEQMKCLYSMALIAEVGNIDVGDGSGHFDHRHPLTTV